MLQSRRRRLSARAGGATGAAYPPAAGRRAPGVARPDQPATVRLLVNGTSAGPGADTTREASDARFRPARPAITVAFRAAGATDPDSVAKPGTVAALQRVQDLWAAGFGAAG